MLMKLIVKLFGKKIVDGAVEKSGLSKTKVIAVIAVIVTALETLAPAFGWNIKIPPELLQLLAGAGLWSLRDGVDNKPNA